MLRALRSGGFSQVLMAVVVFAIIAVFVLEFRAAGGQRTGSLQRQCTAKVAGYCVSVKDFYAAYGLVVPGGMQAKHVKSLSLREHILEGLVERELLVSEAERLGVSVSDQVVDDELAHGRAHVSLPAEHALRLGYTLRLTVADPPGYQGRLLRELDVKSPKTREFDYEIYQRVVRNTSKRSPKEFKEIQRRELIAARMRDLVRARVQVAEGAAWSLFAQERSKAVVRFVQADVEWFSRYAADASDEAARKWDKEHADDVKKALDTEKPVYNEGCPLVSEIVIVAAPDAQEADKLAAREKIERAKGHLDRGEPFGLVARELSEGPTAFVGGELGCLSEQGYGRGAKPLLFALQELKPGQVSDIVESERGYHLIRFEGRLEGDPQAVARLHLARRLAVQAEAQGLARKFADELIKSGGVGMKLEDATRDLVAQFSRETVVLGAKPKSKKNGEQDKGEESAAEESAPLRDSRHPKVEISAPFTVNQNPVPGTVPTVSPAQLAFLLDKPDSMHPEPLPTLSGFAVMQLKEKTMASREEFDKDKEQFLGDLRFAMQQDALTSYVERLRESRKNQLELNARLVSESSAAESGDE